MKKNIFEENNITKAIFTLALPAMLGQITTLIYNMADTYFVSLTNDPNQISAVTLCTPILLIIMSLGIMFGIGASSLIARLLGSNEKNKAKRVASYSIYTTIFSSIFCVILGLLFLAPITNLTGANNSTFEFTKSYLKYIIIGSPFIMFGNSLIHVFRSVGLIKQATIGLMIGNIANIVLDFVFVVFFKMGTTGVAIATVIGFVLNTLYYIIQIVLYKKKYNENTLTMNFNEYKPTVDITKEILAIGIPGALVTILLSISNLILNNFIGKYGSNAVASYGIAYKINTISIMLSVGLSQGITPLFGYIYGAKNYNKLKKSVVLSCIYSVVLGIVFTVLFLLLRNPLCSIFLNDSELLEQSSLFLTILSISGFAVGIINVITAYYQAIGKAIQCLAITLLKNIVIFLPLVIIFNNLFGLSGTLASQPITEVFTMIVCLILYKLNTKINE